MTVAEVIEGLALTGTGPAKLERMRLYAERERPGVPKDEFCDWVSRHISAVTAEKARHLAAGRPLDELLGQPPPRSREKEAMDVAKQVERLIDVLAEKKAEGQAEAQALSIGAPRRPSKREE